MTRSRVTAVAPAFCYLASDAAGYTTSEFLHVDGGRRVCRPLRAGIRMWGREPPVPPVLIR